MISASRALWVLLLSSFIIASCGDDPTSPTGDSDVSTHYLPLSVGSTWEYEGVYSGLEIKGDTTIDGKAYAIHQYTGQPASFARRDGSSYYSLNSLVGQELLLLKEDPVGTTWSVDYTDPSGNTPNKADFEVAAYLDSHKVGGFIYHDVLHITTKYSANGIQYATGDMYFARGIGLIEQTGAGITLKLKSFNVVGSTATVDTAEAGTIEGGMAQVKLDGTAWAIESAEFDEYNDGIELKFSSGNLPLSRDLYIAAPVVDPGTYSLRPDDAWVSYSWQLLSSTMQSDGELVITSNTNTEIEGTFWVTMENGMKFTEGTFRIEK